MVIALWWLACAPKERPDLPVEVAEPDVAWHRESEQRASALVPDPRRGGPAIPRDASPLPPFQGVNRATATYVGSVACSGCHPFAAEKWATTEHSHAFDILVERKADQSPTAPWAVSSINRLIEGETPDDARLRGDFPCRGSFKARPFEAE